MDKFGDFKIIMEEAIVLLSLYYVTFLSFRVTYFVPPELGDKFLNQVYDKVGSVYTKVNGALLEE